MNYVCENPASDRHADNKTFSNQPWNPSFGQYAGQMLENPGPQRIEAGSKANPIVLTDPERGSSLWQELPTPQKLNTDPNLDDPLCQATIETFIAQLKSVLLDGQSLSEKCKLQHDQIIRLRRESQGLQYRKSAWKENYRKAEVELKSERQRAYKRVKDLEEKVRDLSQQVENLEGKLKRARMSARVGYTLPGDDGTLDDMPNVQSQK
ncbi:MAG: hypothetical protein LQ339_008512 [Xanthoria mediterranea]|nr:MAG: hypothetical protein LQ339_008512 [Xanthoria mediterranea]